MREPGAGADREAKIQRFPWATFWGRLIVVGLGGLLFLWAFRPLEARPKREITLITRSVPLSLADSELARVGDLRFLGGAWLSSADEGFGGLSGLTLEESGNVLGLLAVTDQGELLRAEVVLADKEPPQWRAAAIEPLLGEGGKPVLGKSFSDAESIARLPDGRFLVGFERRHRLWAYGPGLRGPARIFETPPALRESPSNGGLESVATWPDGRVLAISEGLKTASGNLAAFLFQSGNWSSLEWTPSGAHFEPADATVLPDGDLLLLERSFLAGAPIALSSRIVRVKAAMVRPGARLQGRVIAELKAPLVAENFEGIATFRNQEGRLRIALVSDDNFSSLQRTLLLWFELVE